MYTTQAVLLGALSEVRKNGVAITAYEYDDNGNRKRVTTPAGVVDATTDAQDRLVTYGGASYGYTAAGELSYRAVGADTTRYRYDALGNLLEVALPTGMRIEYVVDAENRRVGRKVDGRLMQGWLWEGELRPVAELDSTDAVVSRFVYGDRPNVPEYMVRGGRTYRLVQDHLGSVRLVVDVASDAVTQRLDYDAYGQVVFDTRPGFQPFGFAGGLYDGQTGLVRFGARDYDPQLARWTTKDPLGFAGGDANLYGYALSDPVNAVDPQGTYSFAEHIAATSARQTLLYQNVSARGVVGAIGGCAGGAVTATEGRGWSACMNGAIVGGALGAASAFGAGMAGASWVKISPASQAVGSALSTCYTSFLTSGMTQTMGGRELDGGLLMAATAAGCLSGGASKFAQEVDKITNPVQAAVYAGILQRSASILATMLEAEGLGAFTRNGDILPESVR